MQQPTKMRITLFGQKGRLISDRLVEQAIELKQGPKSTHEGAMTLEFNLSNKEEGQLAADYLQTLIGNLPLKKDKPVKIKKGTVQLDDKEPITDFKNQALKKAQTQEQLINFLTEHGFRFIDSEVVTDLVPELVENLKFKAKHKPYQVMTRIVKEAKDPRNDKYDYRLMFAIKIVGKKRPRVHVYSFGKFDQTVKLEWGKEKLVNFKKVKQLLKFPKHMDYEERKRWRVEHRKVTNNPNHKPSAFYDKHKPFIQIT